MKNLKQRIKEYLIILENAKSRYLHEAYHHDTDSTEFSFMRGKADSTQATINDLDMLLKGKSIKQHRKEILKDL